MAEQGKQHRQYMPITLTPESALVELDMSAPRHSGTGAEFNSAVEQIAECLLSVHPTPLQAQALLVRAWMRVQKQGYLSPFQDRQRMETE